MRRLPAAALLALLPLFAGGAETATLALQAGRLDWKGVGLLPVVRNPRDGFPDFPDGAYDSRRRLPALVAALDRTPCRLELVDPSQPYALLVPVLRSLREAGSRPCLVSGETCQDLSLDTPHSDLFAAPDSIAELILLEDSLALGFGLPSPPATVLTEDFGGLRPRFRWGTHLSPGPLRPDDSLRVARRLQALVRAHPGIRAVRLDPHPRLPLGRFLDLSRLAALASGRPVAILLGAP